MAIIASLIDMADTYLTRRFLPKRKQRVIARDVQVRNDAWTVIPVCPELTVELRKQEVALSVPGAWLDFEVGEYAHLSDGTVIKADVELQDQSGEWHTLDNGSFGVSGVGKVSRIGFTVDQPTRSQNMRFVSLRIRAAEPFVCSQIVWHCFDLK